MKQRRLSHREKTELFTKYETGKYTGADLAGYYNISSVAVNALLRRHGYKAKSQSELQRKYNIDETFFDVIDTEEKAYFLGFLYADGYNNTDRNSVALSLKESDKDILIRLNSLIQPDKPLQYVEFKKETRGYKNSSNQYRLVIANKHISERLTELGCCKNKTHTITFPSEEQVPKHLQRHFVRGYFDGDGWVGEKAISIVSTLNFCNSLAETLKEEFNINCYIRARHPERNNSIRMLELNKKSARTFLKWIYKDSNIHLQRKYDRYLKQIEYENSLSEIRICSVDGCNKKHSGNGYCRNHYYEFCVGKEKRKLRYKKHGK
jgi:hypothetical protein